MPTPKEQVLTRYPQAYSVTYGRTRDDRYVEVYAGPISAASREHVTTATLLGRGITTRGAWKNAADYIKPKKVVRYV